DSGPHTGVGTAISLCHLPRLRSSNRTGKLHREGVIVMTEPTGSMPRPPVVPRCYSGLWIAWNEARTEIVGSGRTLDEAREAARAKGELKPVLAKVPKADVRFMGTRA